MAKLYSHRRLFSTILGLCFFTFTSAAKSQVHDLTSWTLRFSAAQSINMAMTGCYGTASYGYVLPTVAYVLGYRTTLLDKAQQAGMNGFAFTSEKDQTGNHVVVDLTTGGLSTVPAVFNAAYKGAVFCQCRTELTQSTYTDGSPNCAHSSQLPPLGVTFLASRDGTSPSPSDDWTDPVTGWQWHFASVAANWRSAMGLCSGGAILPDQPIIAHGARRLWDSPIGLRLRQADSHRVWSSEEFDWYSAMAVYLPGGDAGSVGKQFLFPVLCVKQ